MAKEKDMDEKLVVIFLWLVAVGLVLIALVKLKILFHL
mgnify:CR=1 FL=1|jgi:hypothetical protein